MTKLQSPLHTQLTYRPGMTSKLISMVLQGPELVQKNERDLCEDFGLQELNFELQES
jgi:hypothetical protein